MSCGLNARESESIAYEKNQHSLFLCYFEAKIMLSNVGRGIILNGRSLIVVYAKNNKIVTI